MEILAHETWFTDDRPPYDFSFLTERATLLWIAGAVALTLMCRLIGTRMAKPEIGLLEPLGSLAPWVPRLLAIHAGVSLLAQAASDTYLAPSLPLPQTTTGSTLALLEGTVGVWLISGWSVRWAAALLVAAGPLGMLQYGVLPIVERMDLLGIGLFLAVLPPGSNHYGSATVRGRMIRLPLFSLRLLVGGSLVVLAVTEKLARPDLALAFLDRYPAFNLLQTWGFPVADLDFVRLAGAVELAFGLLIVSGALPQLAVILAGIPFNATLFFLGSSELIGHLPIYGAMLALLIYGSRAEVAEHVPWLPSMSRA